MLNRFVQDNTLKFNQLSTLPALFSEWQNVVYSLLPDNLKKRVSNGQSLDLSKEILGHPIGEYPYKTQEELIQYTENYSNNAACLMYEILLIVNQTGIVAEKWSQSYKGKLLVSLTWKLGLKNLNLLKSYLTSLAEKDKWVPEVVDEKSFQLALVMRMVLSEMLRQDILPFTDKSIKALVIDIFKPLREQVNKNLYLYQLDILNDIDTTHIEATLNETLQLIASAKKKSQSVAIFRSDLKSILLLTEKFIAKLTHHQVIVDALADWADREDPNTNDNRKLHANLVEKLGILKGIESYCKLELSELSHHVANVALATHAADEVDLLRFVEEEKREMQEEKWEARKKDHGSPAEMIVADREILFRHVDPVHAELIHFDDEDEMKVAFPNDAHFDEQPIIGSDVLNDILKKIKNYSSGAVLHYFNRFSLKDISLDIHALLKSILELLGENGKKNAGDAELLPVLIELLPNNKNYLLTVADNMFEMMNSTSGRQASELSNYRAMLYVAIKAKVDVLNNPRLEHSKDLQETVKVILPKLDLLYKYNQRICYLKEITDSYIQYLDGIIEKEINEHDPEGFYFNVEAENVIFDEETGKRYENKVQLHYLEAIVRDYCSKEKENRIKNIVNDNPLFGSLIEKYKVMSELSKKLHQPGVSPKDRLTHFQRHLCANYETLTKNRDSAGMQFLKISGYVLSSVFLMVGWEISYSTFFVSNGKRFADDALANLEYGMPSDIMLASKKRKLV